MSLQPAIPLIVAIMLATIAAMVYGASTDSRALTAVAAAFFAASIVTAAVRVNAASLRAAMIESDPNSARHLHRRNARLAALVYAWGAGALLSIYSVSGLTWRHGWQYGLAMALVAAAILAHVHLMDPAKGAKLPPVWLTLLHGAAAACGIVILVGAGKLETLKRDWAANDVFLFGGLAILSLSIIAAMSQARLAKSS